MLGLLSPHFKIADYIMSCTPTCPPDDLIISDDINPSSVVMSSPNLYPGEVFPECVSSSIRAQIQTATLLTLYSKIQLVVYYQCSVLIG